MFEKLVRVHNLLIGIKVSGNDVFQMAECLQILRGLLEEQAGKEPKE